MLKQSSVNKPLWVDWMKCWIARPVPKAAENSASCEGRTGVSGLFGLKGAGLALVVGLLALGRVVGVNERSRVVGICWNASLQDLKPLATVIKRRPSTQDLKPWTALSSAICTAVLGSLVTSVFAQQADAPKLPRQIAPHLFRMHGVYDLPRALAVPAGQAPEYLLNNLAAWGCTENVNPEGLLTCGEHFISQKRISLKQQATLVEKAKDREGYTRYTVETTDGQHLDIWTTEYGCNYSPDGSKLKGGSIEERLKDLRSPWGPEPYNNIAYNNMLYPGEMPYLQRVAPDGRVLWDYVYLVRTAGYTFDKTGYPQVENPLLGFGEVVCPKGSGATGFLTSTVLAGWVKFTFGAMVIEIDTFTGQPKAKHPRIRVVSAAAVEQHYRRALAELIEEGVITQKDVRISTESYGGVSPPSRFLSKNDEFSERLQRNLLNTYFTNATQGVKK